MVPRLVFKIIYSIKRKVKRKKGIVSEIHTRIH